MTDPAHSGLAWQISQGFIAPVSRSRVIDLPPLAHLTSFASGYKGRKQDMTLKRDFSRLHLLPSGHSEGACIPTSSMAQGHLCISDVCFLAGRSRANARRPLPLSSIVFWRTGHHTRLEMPKRANQSKSTMLPKSSI